MRRGLLLTLLFACGCAVVPPGPLDKDERWKDLMREGHIPSRGTVYLHAPRLERPPGLELAEEAPVSFDAKGHSWYWPAELSPGFADELRKIMRKNSGYEVTLWSDGDGQAARAACDFELQLTVTTYKLELIKAGLGSSMASLWPLGMVHLASFYNAPDELYRCEYRMRATLQSVRHPQAKPVSQELVASKELSLTDFQRGWTLRSYWPEQALGWLPTEDHVTAWREYSPGVVENVEPHSRRTLLIELMRFLRTAPPPGPPRSGSYALVIGVDGAQATQAESDARAVAARLRAAGAADVQLLLGAEATADEAQRRLWARVAGAREGQRTIFYFAGCGAARDGALALSLADRACSLDKLLEPLRAVRRRGGAPVVILDAGFFGGARCADEAAPPSGRALLTSLDAELEGVFVWLSGKGPAGAPESDEAGHGAFTARLLELAPSAPLEELAAKIPSAALLGPADRSIPLLPKRAPRD